MLLDEAAAPPPSMPSDRRRDGRPASGLKTRTSAQTLTVSRHLRPARGPLARPAPRSSPPAPGPTCGLVRGTNTMRYAAPETGSAPLLTGPSPPDILLD